MFVAILHVCIQLVWTTFSGPPRLSQSFFHLWTRLFALQKSADMQPSTLETKPKPCFPVKLAAATSGRGYSTR